MSLVDNLEVHLLRNGFGRESDHPRTIFRRNGKVAEEVVLRPACDGEIIIEYALNSGSYPAGTLARNSWGDYTPDKKQGIFSRK